MDSITYSYVSQNLAATMEKVCNEHVPIMITRDEEDPVVMISLEDFEDFEESAFFRRNPATALRVLEAVHTLEGLKGLNAQQPSR